MGRFRRYLCCCFATEGRKRSIPVQAADVPPPLEPVRAATLLNPAVPQETPETVIQTAETVIETAQTVIETSETVIETPETAEVAPMTVETVTETAEVATPEPTEGATPEPTEVATPELSTESAAKSPEETLASAGEVATESAAQVLNDISDEQLSEYTVAADQLIQGAAATLLERGACGINARDRSHLAAVGHELDEMCSEGEEYSALVLTVAAADLCKDASAEANLTQMAREKAFAFASQAFRQAGARLNTSVPFETESEPIPINPESQITTPHRESKSADAIETTTGAAIETTVGTATETTTGAAIETDVPIMTESAGDVGELVTADEKEMAEAIVDASSSSSSEDERIESMYFRGANSDDSAASSCVCDNGISPA